MPIRNRAVTDTKNPPGQARYLRDVIKKYYEEDRRLDDLNLVPAPVVSTDAEKRLQGLKADLLSLCITAESRDRYDWDSNLISSSEIRKLLDDSTRNP